MQVFASRLANFLLECNVADSVIYEPSFTALFSLFGVKIPGKETIKKAKINLFNNAKQKLAMVLRGYRYACVCTDEWKNVNGDSILMFTLYSPTQEVYYWNQVNMGKMPTTAAAIGAEIETVCSSLNELGITVSGLMTDNCPTMKSVPKSIRFSNVESMNASIIPVGCGPHILNLICKQ